MSDLNEYVKTIRTNIVFKFVETVQGGQFRQQDSKIFIVENRENQLKKARWGRVEVIGEDVTDEIKLGSYILIEPLRWTTAIRINKDSYWITTEKEILAVSDSLPK